MDASLGRFSLLASAMASRRLAVAVSDGGQTYTDGDTIYVDASAPRADVRDGVAMQATLLAAGSLSRGTLLRLSRHRRIVTQRYLSLEVARLAAELHGVLPPATVRRVQSVYPRPLSSSSAQSLKRALSGARVAALPDWVGTVKVIRLLRAGGPEHGGSSTADNVDTPDHIERDGDRELTDDEEDDSERSRMLELFASPLSNPLSDAIKRLLGVSSAASDDNGGGAQLPVSGRRFGAVGPRAKRTRFARAIATMFAPAAAVGARYPEWDEAKNVYRPQWCAVAEYDPPESGSPAASVIGAGSVRRSLARVGIEQERHRRQPDGDSVDISALVDYVTSRRLGDSPDPLVYEQTLLTKRDLSVLVLLDCTGSTNEESDGRSIFEEERRLAGELTASLDDLGDRVATFAFYSHGRDCVKFLRVKGFADRFDTAAKRRLSALQPSGFTRLGAALRHAIHLLQSQAVARNMILIVVGDGLPYDDGYEDSYARADTRRAIQEAVWSGVGVVGLAIRSSVEREIHEDIWSEVPFRVVQNCDDARKYLRPLLLDALSVTRSNGRRRELSNLGDHAQLQAWMAKGRSVNSYV